MDVNHIRLFNDVKQLAFLQIKGVLTWGRFTVIFLRTTVMLTVYCNLHEIYISGRAS